VSFGLQVLDVADETDRIDDTLVVEEHTSDLTGGLAVLLLDVMVDVVTDLLATLGAIKGLDTLKISRRYKQLLLLLLLHHLGLVL